MCLVLWVAAVLSAVGTTLAEDLPPEEPPAGPADQEGATREFRGVIQRWGIALGGFRTDFATKARWNDANLGPGTTVSLEDDLGLDEDITRARLDFTVRTGKRSLVEMTYLRLRRSAVRTLLDREVYWGDRVFRLGATVESDFDTDVYKIGWTYGLVQRPRFRLGLSLGISVFDLYGSIRGVAQAEGVPGNPAFFEEESEQLLAPVPVIGLGMSGHLTHRLILRAHGQIFSYDDDAWEVDFVDTLAAIEYAAFKHVSFGVGYDYFRIEYDQDKYDLYANYTFQGAMFYIRVVY